MISEIDPCKINKLKKLSMVFNLGNSQKITYRQLSGVEANEHTPLIEQLVQMGELLRVTLYHYA